MSRVVVGQVLAHRGKVEGRVLDFMGIEVEKGGAFVHGLALGIIVRASLWETGLHLACERCMTSF